jgi:hypothetical protein
MSSLSAMLFLGDTGITAAIKHAPKEDGIQRFVFYCFPHIGFNSKGVPGKLERHGIEGESTCCGALDGFHKELQGGVLKMETNLHDVEQSLLKQRLLRHINIKELPDIVSLTKIAHQAVEDDLEALLARNLLNKLHYEYAVFTGVHIHAPSLDDPAAVPTNFLWPSPAYVMTKGQSANHVKAFLQFPNREKL